MYLLGFKLSWCLRKCPLPSDIAHTSKYDILSLLFNGMVFRMPNSPPSLPEAISQVPLPSLQITKILREEPSVMVFEQIILKFTLRLNMRFCAVWKGNFVVRMMWYECQIWDQFRNWLKKIFFTRWEPKVYTDWCFTVFPCLYVQFGHDSLS